MKYNIIYYRESFLFCIITIYSYFTFHSIYDFNFDVVRPICLLVAEITSSASITINKKGSYDLASNIFFDIESSD